jgi:hypothetical protein
MTTASNAELKRHLIHVTGISNVREKGFAKDAEKLLLLFILRRGIYHTVKTAISSIGL